MDIKGTTILGVRYGGEVAIAGDGQVTLGDTVLKSSGLKIRKLYNDTILAGFAGSAADSFTLLERFETKLEAFKGKLEKSAIELAKEWRTDKYLRRLEAILLVMNEEKSLVISGTGDVVEPDEQVVGIGSGGAYARAAALALIETNTSLKATEIAKLSLEIASKICIYTNSNIKVLTL